MIDSLKNKEVQMRWLFFAVLFLGFAFINFPFFMPLALAGIFALGLQDLVTKVTKRTGWKRRWWILITIFGGILLFILPLFLAVYRAITWIMKPENMESQRIVGQLHIAKNFVVEGLAKVSEWTGQDVATPARDTLESILHKAGEFILSFSTTFAGELPAIVVALLVFILGVAVMLFNHQEIHDFVIDYSFFDSELTEKIIVIFKKSCSITLFSTFVIGLIQATVIGIGSLVFGEGDFWLVVTVTFFVSFIPVIGAAPVGFFLALLAFLGERVGPGIGLTLVALFAGTIDNILKPFLVSGDFNVNALIGFTSVVGAIIVLGLPGLLLGPVIMNIFVGISPLLLKNRKPETTPTK